MQHTERSGDVFDPHEFGDTDGKHSRSAVPKIVKIWLRATKQAGVMKWTSAIVLCLLPRVLKTMDRIRLRDIEAPEEGYWLRTIGFLWNALKQGFSKLSPFLSK